MGRRQRSASSQKTCSRSSLPGSMPILRRASALMMAGVTTSTRPAPRERRAQRLLERRSAGTRAPGAQRLERRAAGADELVSSRRKASSRAAASAKALGARRGRRAQLVQALPLRGGEGRGRRRLARAVGVAVRSCDGHRRSCLRPAPGSARGRPRWRRASLLDVVGARPRDASSARVGQEERLDHHGDRPSARAARRSCAPRRR